MQIEGEKWKQWQILFSWAPKSLRVVTAAMKLKDAGVLFLPPSDAYVRSFLYLLYTLIKLYYTKALSDQALSLAPDWILLLQGPRILVYSRDSTTTFQHRGYNIPWTARSPDVRQFTFSDKPYTEVLFKSRLLGQVTNVFSHWPDCFVTPALQKDSISMSMSC